MYHVFCLLTYNIISYDFGHVYIGERGRSAKQRMVEHKTEVNDKEENSHIYKLKMVKKRLIFDFDQVEIAAPESIEHHGRFIEAIHTKTHAGNKK